MENQKQNAIKEIALLFGSHLTGNSILWYDSLVQRVNELINVDFEKLLQILYRLDVSEQKLKLLLRASPDADAAKIIADLIIERQIQKIKTRQQFSRRDDNISDEDKW